MNRLLLTTAIAGLTMTGAWAQRKASPFCNEKSVALHGTTSTINVGVNNSGDEEITSITYRWECNGKSGEGNYSFRPSLPNRGNVFRYIPMEIEVPEATGEYPLSITITKVNSYENEHQRPTDQTILISSPIEHVNRPLVDEFTGTWCQNCPIGYVVLETMAEEYGHDFVAGAWHNNDPMAVMRGTPVSNNEYPNSSVNRDGLTDLNTLESTWIEARNQYTPAIIAVTADFTDDTKTKLKATATVTWMEDASNLNCAIGYMLVADGLSNPKWGQANIFTGTGLTGKYSELFTQGGSMVFGLTFNDVVVGSGRARGENNSMPASLKAFESCTHDFEFDVAEFKTVKGEPLDVDVDKLRVIAYVFDRTEIRLLNSVSSLYPGEKEESGVEGIEAEGADVVSTVWYDLSGRPAAQSQEGVLIRVDILSDGSVKTSKTLKK